MLIDLRLTLCLTLHRDYRAGLIEKRGRGTNRVADMCRTAGVAPPDFAEMAGAAVVTFRVAVAAGGMRPGEVTGEVTGTDKGRAWLAARRSP